MNFRFLAHLDTRPVLAVLSKREPLAIQGGDKYPFLSPDEAAIMLRAPEQLTPAAWVLDGKLIESLARKEWPAIERLLNNVRRTVLKAPEAFGKIDPAAAMGRAYIAILKPGGHTPWQIDKGQYADHHLRFHVALTTNPGCVVYSGGESGHIPVGALWWVNHVALHSEVNLGKLPRIHLVVDFRRSKEKEEE